MTGILLDAPERRTPNLGFRADAHARGGDIDLLIASETLDRGEVRQIRLDLQDCLGARHFDVVLPGPRPSAFARAVAEEA